MTVACRLIPIAAAVAVFVAPRASFGADERTIEDVDVANTAIDHAATDAHDDLAPRAWADGDGDR